ncbi:MAG: family 16 glycosylhydrolase [Opitutaceae bacterium]
MLPFFRACLWSSLVLIWPLRAAPPPAPPGFTWVRHEAFSDEFDGDRLDLAKWHDHHPYWEGRAPAKFIPRSVSVRDGMLRIRNSVLRPAEATGKFTLAGGAVVSRSAAAHYGYYETRMKASSVAMSSTFWLANQPVAVPGGTAKQEIDINEAMGVSKSFPKWRTAMHANTHYFFNPAGDEKKDQSRPGQHAITPAADEAFHTYGAWWVDANTVHYYCDDAFVFTLHPDTTYSPTPFDRPMYLNLVTETYAWEKPPTAADLADDAKNTTYYDWVRAYTLTAKPEARANLP